MPADDQAYQDLVDRIHYSDRYSDDYFEYRRVSLSLPPRRSSESRDNWAELTCISHPSRHVLLPRQMLKLIPKDYFEPDSNVLRLLTEDEWRGIGITQSLGWEHYEVHAPEPHVLLFRREKDYQAKNAQPRY
ncbi:hypothetical protein Rhopal_001358-T1 [Rhodotorula paludigena]|uniref:Cyclin-dependent kinases regulatory subunit n=1 Tax=Rhodotorula paludigena TaxID=86838 RepID=A0AAV5GGC6_9BASI|nr:hypothetical protein Rhopal_001358-T1 [Rhodotorula paludigena]